MEREEISKKRLAELTEAELKAAGVTLKTRKTKRGTIYTLTGSGYELRKLVNKAKRRIIAKRWVKLGGKLSTLCERCEWLSLGYSSCTKCGVSQ